MNWRKVPGCVSMCKCGYPVRAKEVRDNIFKKVVAEDGKPHYIYCERSSDGQGHVYYGTRDQCLKGNGLAFSGFRGADKIIFYDL